MKKSLGKVILGLLLFFGLIWGYVSFTAPPLPSDAEQVLEEVFSTELPELVQGKTGIAQNDDVNIWYEVRMPKDTVRGTVLLIMGLSLDALAWSNHFIDPIVNAGYRVIRFDNRCTGLSDWMEEDDKPFLLEDMARDGLAVLNAVGVKHTHVIGLSLGGMIAQVMAIQYPDRVLSLSSVMSSGFVEDPDLPKVPKSFLWDLYKLRLKYFVQSEQNIIKHHLAVRNRLLGKPESPLNTIGVAREVLYNLRKRKGYNPKAMDRQVAAIENSGGRYKSLSVLSQPTLIIHGKLDKLIPFEHGEKCAQIIPNAESLWIENMGHQIILSNVPIILDKIFQLMMVADVSR